MRLKLHNTTDCCSCESLNCCKESVFSVLNIFFFDDERNKTGKIDINAILRNIRLTTVVVQKQQVLYIEWLSVGLTVHCAIRMRHAHAPYCIVICGPSASTIFLPHYLIKGTIFEIKKLLTFNRLMTYIYVLPHR